MIRHQATAGHSIDSIQAAARGRWPDIYASLLGWPAETIARLASRKGGPCPACGGTDRFAPLRTFAEDGALLCRHCLPRGGDGLTALQHFGGWTFVETLDRLARHLGLAASPGKSVKQILTPPKALRRDASGAIAFAVSRCKSLGDPSRHYVYHDASGQPVGIVLRWDRDNGKEVKQFAKIGNQWQAKAMPEPRPLYGLPDVLTAETVYVAEGEKCVDTLTSLGLAATTSCGGSRAAKKTDWKHLAGKHVYILPDRDEPGEWYCDDVTAAVANIALSVRVVRLSHPDGTTHEGYDVADWVDDCRSLLGWTDSEIAAELSRLADAAEVIRPSAPSAPQTLPEPRKYEPFPVDLLPGVVGEHVSAVAAAMCCDPAYAAMPLLASLAAAVGNSRRIRIKRSWCEPCVFWFVAIGESGVMKSPPMDHVLTFIRSKQDDEYRQFVDDQKSYEKERLLHDVNMTTWRKGAAKATVIESAPEPPEPPVWRQRVVDDTTTEAVAELLSDQPRGILVATDELSGWVARFDAYKASRGGDAAQWLTMHRAGLLLVNRKTGRKLIRVPRAATSICGTIQPVSLKRALAGQAGADSDDEEAGADKGEHIANGLLARMLLAHPPRKAKRWTEDDVNSDLQQRMRELFERLFALEMPLDEQGEPQSVDLTMSSGARRAWIAYYDQHARETVEQTTDVAAAWSKLEGYAARFALLIQLIEDAESTEISAEAMESGIALSRWFGGEAERIYGEIGADAGGDRGGREASRLAAWIRSRGGSVTERDCQRGPRWLREPGKAEGLARELVELGLAGWRMVGPSQDGGRPVRKLVILDECTLVTGDTTPGNAGKTEVLSPGRADFCPIEAGNTNKLKDCSVKQANSDSPDSPNRPCQHSRDGNPEGRGDTTPGNAGKTEVLSPVTRVPFPQTQNLPPGYQPSTGPLVDPEMGVWL